MEKIVDIYETKDIKVIMWKQVDDSPADENCVYLHTHEIIIDKLNNSIKYNIIDARGLIIKQIEGSNLYTF